MEHMTMLPVAAPHPDAVELRCWTLDSFRGLRGLRDALRDTTASSATEVSDRLAVVATELATNALRHGLPPTVVRLLGVENPLILDVSDHDLTSPPELADDRPLGAGGLGLRLTRTFAA